jgi:fructose-specific phosphotransferase system IIA component
MKITDVLKKENIIFELKAQTKDEIIDELINSLKQNKQIKNINKLKDAILEREEVLSTGIGKGVAIPHCRTDAVEGIIIAFGKTLLPVDFESLDNKPVLLIFLIASNEAMKSEHLKLLNQIGKMASNDELLSRIVRAKDSDEIYNILAELDNSNNLIGIKY